jgi:hypothetical protein
VRILRRQVSTLADFVRKSELVSVLCGLHKKFKGLLKIKGSLLKFLKVQRLMSLPRPIRPYYFHADLIW